MATDIQALADQLNDIRPNSFELERVLPLLTPGPINDALLLLDKSEERRDDEIKELENRIDSLEEEVVDLEKEVIELENKETGYLKQIAALQSEVSA